MIGCDWSSDVCSSDLKDLDKDAIKVNLKDEDNNVIELTVANTPNGQKSDRATPREDRKSVV